MESDNPSPPRKRQRVGTSTETESFIPHEIDDGLMNGDETNPGDGNSVKDNDALTSSFVHPLNLFSGAVEHAGQDEYQLYSKDGSSIIFNRGLPPTQKPPPQATIPIVVAPDLSTPSTAATGVTVATPHDDGSFAENSAEAYKYQICLILEIEYDKFSDVSLDILRGYARVFNGHVRGNDWTPPTGMIDPKHGDVYVKIRSIMKRDPVVKCSLGYFAEFRYEWLRIADHRGDPVSFDSIDPDDESTLGTYFSPRWDKDEDTEELKKALGIIDNPFGKFPGYI